MLVEVPQFSKFIHGMALLHAPGTSVTPTWFLEDKVAAGTFIPATIEEMADERCKYTEVGWVGASTAPLPVARLLATRAPNAMQPG